MYLTDVWNLSYEEYVQHLLKKYGPAEHDYFDDKGNFTASRTWSSIVPRMRHKASSATFRATPPARSRTSSSTRAVPS